MDHPPIQKQKEEEEEAVVAATPLLTTSPRQPGCVHRINSQLLHEMVRMVQRDEMCFSSLGGIIECATLFETKWGVGYTRGLLQALLHVHHPHKARANGGSPLATSKEFVSSQFIGLLPPPHRSPPPLPGVQWPRDGPTVQAILQELRCRVPWVARLIEHEVMTLCIARVGDIMFLHASPAFHDTFLPPEGIIPMVQAQRLLGLWLYDRFIAPEDSENFYRQLTQVTYSKDRESEVAMVARCITKEGHVFPCLLRYRADMRSDTWATALVFSIRPLLPSKRLHAICPSKPAATRLRGTEGEDGGDRGNRRRKVVVADSDSSTTSESSSSSIGGGKE